MSFDFFVDLCLASHADAVRGGTKPLLIEVLGHALPVALTVADVSTPGAHGEQALESRSISAVRCRKYPSASTRA